MRTQIHPQSQPQSQCRPKRVGYQSRHRGSYNPRRQNPRSEWIEVDQITVELTENSVRIRFPEKPTDKQREHLKKVGGMWWSKAGYWFNKLTDANTAFARSIEANGFPDGLSPVEQVWNDNEAVACGAD